MDAGTGGSTCQTATFTPGVPSVFDTGFNGKARERIYELEQQLARSDEVYRALLERHLRMRERLWYSFSVRLLERLERRKHWRVLHSWATLVRRLSASRLGRLWRRASLD